jgi:hypothetical protein
MDSEKILALEGLMGGSVPLRFATTPFMPPEKASPDGKQHRANQQKGEAGIFGLSG